ncbi:MAG: LL-diaminopimelate aminotransferase [Clostridia bacterium]|nr:LL-diaminopimelate aminotransferase [Clostridia bacterium]
MSAINTNFLSLERNYLFAEVARQVREYKLANPDKSVISLGIGDVTMPLPRCAVEAIGAAAAEMGAADTFRGYGPEQGYDFLRDGIADYYRLRGVELESREIFVSDGAKSDLGNILDIFDRGIVSLIPDPVYPVYLDTNIMAGNKVVYAKADESNDFLPMPDYKIDADVVYLCSPNNPTGAAYNAAQLGMWVDYALAKGAVILYDAAYERFIKDDLPHSIYEIEGAKECAIEFCSFSKTAGFTGTRCGWTVVPDALAVGGVKLNGLWLRRQCTKFNGVPYIVQRAAQAVLSDKGLKEIDVNIDYYRRNAQIISGALCDAGVEHCGGKNSPYIWLKCGCDSWDYFRTLLCGAQVVGTPGSGFGKCGEGYFRLTAFSSYENTLEACKRIKSLYRKI